jgi:hypothetical protein
VESSWLYQQATAEEKLKIDASFDAAFATDALFLTDSADSILPRDV